MKLKHVLLILLALAPVIYVIAIWKSMPETIPTHFNLHGDANGWSSKAGFITLIAVMAGVSIGTYLLLVNIHKIDPKRAMADNTGAFDKIAVGLVLFLTALNVVIIISCLHPEDKIIDRALLPLMGLMFVFLGNYMHNVKPNYFVGIRVPWTMHDEENWRLTHRLAGVIWFAGGLVIAILPLFTSLEVGMIAMQIVLAVMILVPIGYSYTLFRKKQSSNTHKDKL